MVSVNSRCLFSVSLRVRLSLSLSLSLALSLSRAGFFYRLFTLSADRYLAKIMLGCHISFERSFQNYVKNSLFTGCPYATSQKSVLSSPASTAGPRPGTGLLPVLGIHQLWIRRLCTRTNRCSTATVGKTQSGILGVFFASKLRIFTNHDFLAPARELGFLGDICHFCRTSNG